MVTQELAYRGRYQLGSIVRTARWRSLIVCKENDGQRLNVRRRKQIKNSYEGVAALGLSLAAPLLEIEVR